MDRKTKTAVLTLFLVLGTFQVSAQQSNASEVRNQLQEAEDAIQQMNNTGIPVERVESLLTTANNSFKAQKALEEEGGTPDHTRTVELTEKILELKETSIQVNDRLEALQGRIDQLENNRNLNLTEVKNAFQRVNTTFHNQRFLEAEGQVDQVYTEISEAQSAQTQLQAFAASQRQNFASVYSSTVSYTSENWLVLLIAGGLIGGVGYVARQELKLVRLEKKKADLKEEKEIIQQMIEQAQREYFVKRKGSKITFETRMEKFQEMLRDAEESLKTVENRIEKLEGVPVVTPKIKEKAEEFTESGEIKSEIEEVEKPVGQQISGKEEETSEEAGKQEESSETEEVKNRVNPYEVLVNESTVKEAKARIEKIEGPDYEAIMEAEKANKDRVTLERFLERRIEEQEEKEEEGSEEDGAGDKKEDREEKPVEVTDTEGDEEAEATGKNKEDEVEQDVENIEKGEEEDKQEDREDTVEPEVKVVEPEEEVRDVSQTVEEVESPKTIETEGKETIEQELGPEFTSHPAARPEDEEISETDTEKQEHEEETEEEDRAEEAQEKPVEVKDEEEKEEAGVEQEEEDKSAAEKLQEAFSKASKGEEDVEEGFERSKETEKKEKDSESGGEESEEEDQQKKSSEDSEGDKGLEVVEKNGKYLIPGLDKEFDTESAANLYLEHFG
jgi:hypothetical protein